MQKMTDLDAADAPRRGPWRIGWIPLALFAYPALAGILGRSEFPTVLGRYSVSFLVFNVWSATLIATTLIAVHRRRSLWLQASLLAILLTTLVVPANNQLRDLPAISLLLPAIRLSCALAILLVGFHARRSRPAQAAGWWVGIGMLWVLLSVVDFALLGVLALSPEQRRIDRGWRVSHDLQSVGPDDVILVGDSFVWGQGVTVDERFGNRLEELLREQGRSPRVFSMGQLGFGLNQYLSTLRLFPVKRRAARVLVAYYMNDMPPPETAVGKLNNVVLALGRGFPTFRLVGDKVAKLMTADVEAYHAQVVESYRPGHPTFEHRWALLGEQLARIHEEAVRRSEQPPVLLILPLMVDFHDYPLERATAELARLGADRGFEVIDLLPLFREKLGDGTLHRNEPGDNHFDAATHELVARILYGHLTAEAATERLISEELEDQ